MAKSIIKFYSALGEHGYMSNFSKHSFVVNGERWKTSEHYYQAQKYTNNRHRYSEIKNQKTPALAAKLGRDKSFPIREDWEFVKDQIMFDAISAKFEQNPDIKAKLLGTEGAHLVEDSLIDYYWGCGKNGTGKNMLGVLLMLLRDKLGSQL